MGNFLPFYHPNPKMKISKKMKKSLEISSFYTSVPRIMIICYTVREIQCVTNVTASFHFWATFCPFTPITAWKMKILIKWKKHLDISSFYTGAPKIMIMLYCSCDMTHDTLNCYFSFWANFCPLTPLAAQKLKISKKKTKKKNNSNNKKSRKKLLEISLLYTCVP